MTSPSFQIVETDEAWRRIERNAPENEVIRWSPVFVTPDWLDAAWLWQGPGTARHFIVAKDESEVCAFAPLIITTKSVAGVAVRTMRWLTVPDTQFADLAVSAQCTDAFLERVAQHLRSHKSQWDCLRLTHLSDSYDRWRRLSNALSRVGIEATVECIGTNPFVDLSSEFEAYYSARSRSLKKAVNLSANRLAKAGHVSVEWVREGSGVDAALAEAIRVSGISWKRETGNSLDQTGPRAFIGRLTDRMQRIGSLSIWLLRLDGKVIASEYQIIADGDVYALRSDFDPACSDLSPGTFLNHHLLKNLFGEGLQRYYMGPGANVYKMRWTDRSEPIYQMMAYSPTTRGQLLRWVDRSARPLARSVRALVTRTRSEQQSPPTGASS